MRKYKKYKDYKVVKDNKMRWQGDTDLDKKIIRINPKKSKKKSGKGGVIDTIVHELYHADHPKATEKKTYKETPKKVKKLTPKQKKRLYRLISK
jgi:predicted SprT family Zn-dependent metalloprotease